MAFVSGVFSYLLRLFESIVPSYLRIQPTPQDTQKTSWFDTNCGLMKCYNCGEPKEPGKVFCKDCEGKPVKATSTLIIYDKI